MTKNKKLAIGDILVYCPTDLQEKHHDVGVVYEIEKININNKIEIKRYKILWNRSKRYDVYSHKPLMRKIQENLIYIINETK